MIGITHLSYDGIINKLESQRLGRLEKAAANLKSDLIGMKRCPTCTLIIPCKHYTDAEQVFSGRRKIF